MQKKRKYNNMIEVKIFFEELKSVIYEELLKANLSVIIAVAWINFKEYYSLFDELLKKNIELSIICSDNKQNKSHLSEINKLKTKGANIRLLKMPSLRNHMHNKFVVIDNIHIINGSFNWSPNAEKSFENLMVIKNDKISAKKIKDEFNQLLSIETQTIKYLHKKNKCKEKGCNGQLFNILVFSERATKYFETYGDIISVCNECFEYKSIVDCVSNTQLEMLLNELGSASDDYEYEMFDKYISELLMEYQNNDVLIHAIGRVNTTLDGRDDEWTNTIVLWKNKFVGDKIPNEFENEAFDVYYDN